MAFEAHLSGVLDEAVTSYRGVVAHVPALVPSPCEVCEVEMDPYVSGVVASAEQWVVYRPYTHTRGSNYGIAGFSKTTACG